MTDARANMQARHQEFLADLYAGRRIELAVGIALLDAGLTVRMGPLDAAATPYESSRFADQADILVDGDYRIEVKSSRYAFTGPEDWPFAHGVYICRVARWEKWPHPPHAFVIVSQQTEAMLAVSSKSRPLWKIVDSQNRRADGRTDGAPAPTYCAPVSVMRPLAELVAALLEAEEAVSYAV